MRSNPMNEGLSSINLSLSSACGADCIFCPSDRGKRISAKNMPLEIAKKIIDEMASDSYREVHQTTRMHIGENGDCFINKSAIEILRYIKSQRPDVLVCVYTNVQFFTPEKIEIVMRESLLDFVGLNIDGADERSFFAAKKLSAKYVEEFIPRFIESRERHKASTRLDVECLTTRHYVDAVRAHLGRNPSRIDNPSALDLEDDFERIKANIVPMLRDGDHFGRAWPVFWAERDAVDVRLIDYNNYTCPQMQRVCTEAFIAPDGTWYACCLDSNNKLALGNVYETSLQEVAVGEPRRSLIRKLAARKFAEIGGPCASVNCCQLGISQPLKHLDHGIADAIED